MLHADFHYNAWLPWHVFFACAPKHQTHHNNGKIFVSFTTQTSISYFYCRMVVSLFPFFFFTDKLISRSILPAVPVTPDWGEAQAGGRGGIYLGSFWRSLSPGNSLVIIKFLWQWYFTTLSHQLNHNHWLGAKGWLRLSQSPALTVLHSTVELHLKDHIPPLS